MKTFTLFTIIVISLLPNQMFSQTINQVELRQDHLLQERIIPRSISDEQIKHPSKSDIFNDKESRTLVNKTILDNGFLLIEILSQDWDGTNWVNFYKWTHTYDVNNNRIEWLWQHWDGSNWVNFYKWTYTYDGNNNLIEELYQPWNGTNWVNDGKDTYTYDGNNNNIEYLGQNWDGSNWVNVYKRTYTYDGNNNMIELLAKDWDGSNWVIEYKHTYTYDVNNNRIERLWQDWDGFNWVNYLKSTYTYDVNNNMIESLSQNWDGSVWVNSSKYTYSYVPITDIEQLVDGIKAYSLSNNFPNPFNPSTTISYSVPEIVFVTLKVYDVLGNEVATLVNEQKPVGNYKVEFSVGQNSILSLSSGIYFYRLQAGSFVETKKMVMMK